MRTLVHRCRELKMRRLLWDGIWQFLNVKPDDPATPSVGVYPKELKIGTQTNPCTAVLTAALFTTAKKGKQPRWPPMEDGSTKWGLSTQGNIIQPDKGMEH